MSFPSSTFWAHQPVHSEERAISLWLKVLPYQPRPARNPFQVRNSVRPMHLFGHTFDHDYYFELPREEGAGYPINYSMFDFTPSRFPGCPACEPNFSPARNPIPCASSSKGEPPVF